MSYYKLALFLGLAYFKYHFWIHVSNIIYYNIKMEREGDSESTIMYRIPYNCTTGWKWERSRPGVPNEGASVPGTFYHWSTIWSHYHQGKSFKFFLWKSLTRLMGDSFFRCYWPNKYDRISYILRSTKQKTNPEL